MTQYINTDLVISGENLQALDKAFKALGLVALGTIPDGPDVFNMGYETEHQHHDPEPNIEVFLSVLVGLDEAALRVWNACERREFDIGYKCGSTPIIINHTLSPELLRRVTAVNAALRITVYADLDRKRNRSGV
jgi:hypothetical protein